MSTDKTVVIVGGGMCGLLLAKLLSDAQFKVVIIEKKQPRLDIALDALPERVSALNANIVAYLKKIGVWENCHSTRVTPLSQMQVWDDCGGGDIHFDSATIAEPHLACVIENDELVRVLWEQLSVSPFVQIACPEQIEGMTVRPECTLIQTSQGELMARLVVGADGALSTVRNHLPLFQRSRSYQQCALVATVESEYRHDNIALQSFLSTGPLGVLPLAHPQHESIVYSCEKGEAEELLSLTEQDFNQRLGRALQLRFGKMRLLNSLRSFPLIERSMSQPFFQSAVLIGDAAKTIHPLAGQGANSGLQDAIWLAHVFIQSRRVFDADVPLEALLAGYWRRREYDHVLLRQSMRLFAELFAGDASVKVKIRSSGLDWCDNVNFLKNKIMKIMTALGHLPA